MKVTQWVRIFLCTIVFGAVVFFSTYKLFESPETWMDEGFIIQSVIGLLHTGALALPVAPLVFEPAWYMTTGFPVTLPLAGAFSLFGISLEAARVVMVVFLCTCFAVLWIYARRVFSEWVSYLGICLLTFFAPLYGNGRNVLGEVPGILFILLSLLPLLAPGSPTRTRAFLVGMLVGVAVAIKPIFILFAVAFLAVLVLRRREYNLQKNIAFGLLGSSIPLLLWYVLQFRDAAFSQILQLYANPHTIPLLDAIRSNMERFYTEAQPAFFLGLLAIWVASYVVRRLLYESVSITEEILLLFSVLVLCMYLRTAGYYRYFFPAQVFSLLYLPSAALYLGNKLRIRGLVLAGLLTLLAFLAYETTFRSWVAVHYGATRTETFSAYFDTLPPEEVLFIYQVPEAVPFAHTHQFYQYAQVVPGVYAGALFVPQVTSGGAAKVLTSQGTFGTHKDSVFAKYQISETINDYVILVPKQR